MLGVWMVYPAVYTIIRSFFGPTGFLGTWVGIDNYKTLFTTSTLRTAIKNNALWVAVVPAFVTAVGLDLRRAHGARALGGRVQDRGVPADGDLRVRHRRDVADHVPAGSGPRARSTRSARRSPASFSPAGVLSSASPSTPALQATASGALVLKTPTHPGGVALLGLTGDRARPGSEEREAGGRRRRRSRATSSAPSGATSSPAAARPASSRRGSSGCPASPSSSERGREDGAVARRRERRRHLRLREGPGRDVSTPRSARRRSRSRSAATRGSARSLIVPSLFIAYIWIWAGFAMVVIGAGPRGDAARRARGRAHGRRHRVAGRSAASPFRCSLRC